MPTPEVVGGRLASPFGGRQAAIVQRGKTSSGSPSGPRASHDPYELEVYFVIRLEGRCGGPLHELDSNPERGMPDCRMMDISVPVRNSP